jgi:hypothetical protein
VPNPGQCKRRTDEGGAVVGLFPGDEEFVVVKAGENDLALTRGRFLDLKGGNFPKSQNIVFCKASTLKGVFARCIAADKGRRLCYGDTFLPARARLNRGIGTIRSRYGATEIGRQTKKAKYRSADHDYYNYKIWYGPPVWQR